VGRQLEEVVVEDRQLAVVVVEDRQLQVVEVVGGRQLELDRQLGVVE